MENKKSLRGVQLIENIQRLKYDIFDYLGCEDTAFKLELFTGLYWRIDTKENIIYFSSFQNFEDEDADKINIFLFYGKYMFEKEDITGIICRYKGDEFLAIFDNDKKVNLKKK